MKPKTDGSARPAKGGRPKKSADDRLSEHIHFLTTIATRENLAIKASASGVSEGEFLRRMIDGAEMPPARSAVNPALIAALNNYVVASAKLHNNVNQLTAANWQGRDFVQYWREIGRELEADLKAGRAALDALLEDMSA